MTWSRCVAALCASIPPGLMSGSLCLLAGCSTLSPDVGLTIHQGEAGTFVLTLEGNKRVESISQVSIWAEGATEYLWVLQAQLPGTTREIGYGDTDGVGSRGLQQTFPPADETPAAVPPGAVFYVRIVYAYDHMYAASVGSRTYRCRLSRSGVPEVISAVSRFRQPEDVGD